MSSYEDHKDKSVNGFSGNSYCVDWGSLGCRRTPTFRRCMLLPLSGLKIVWSHKLETPNLICSSRENLKTCNPCLSSESHEAHKYTIWAKCKGNVVYILTDRCNLLNSHSGGCSLNWVHSARRPLLAYCTCPGDCVDGEFGGMNGF
jgi:hypothetical protein